MGRVRADPVDRDGSGTFVAFLVGGIASGKSSVARALESRGARRVDLDELSRRVLLPGSPCLQAVLDAFDGDLVGPDGLLDRELLAQRAFADASAAARLEAIELPFIRDELVRELSHGDGRPVVVEVPLLDRMGEMLDLADEIVCVTCPLGLRRERAVARGMDAADFDRRAANQPDDDYLREHATTEIRNGGDEAALLAQADAWWDSWVGKARQQGGGGR